MSRTARMPLRRGAPPPLASAPQGLLLGVTLLVLLCAGCAARKPGGYYQDDGPMPEVAFDPALVPDAVPTAAPRSRSGNPASYEVFGHRYQTLNTATGYKERGRASWYGKKFHGRRTSSGEIYDMFAMTAAHKALPLPTWVRVTHLGNGRSVIVKVNDRGPFVEGRIIDLSYAAAAKLDIIRSGWAEVEVEAVTVAEQQEAKLAPYLEVGNFPDPIEAVALREELSAQGFGALELRSGLQDGETRHRVLAGPFTDITAFRDAHRRLTQRHLPVRPVDE